MRDEEKLAKWLLERAMPGTRMDFRRIQSHGEWDFDLFRPDGSSEPVEVTTSTCEVRERARARIMKGPRGAKQFIARVHSTLDWVVSPGAEADIRRVRAEVDEYLSAVEADGLTAFDFEADAIHSNAVRRIYRDLGVEDGFTLQLNPPRRIAIVASGESITLSADCVNRAVQIEADKVDNMAKLGRSSAAQRHLFVLISPINGSPSSSMQRGLLPTLPLRLTPAITTVWIACCHSAKRWLLWQATTLSWENLGAWEEPGSMLAVDSSAASSCQ